MNYDLTTRLELCAADYNLDSSDTQAVDQLTNDAADLIKKLELDRNTVACVISDLKALARALELDPSLVRFAADEMRRKAQELGECVE